MGDYELECLLWEAGGEEGGVHPHLAQAYRLGKRREPGIGFWGLRV